MAAGFNKYKDRLDAEDLAEILNDTRAYWMDEEYRVRKVDGVYRVFFKPTDELDADWDLICPRMVPN